MKPVNLLLRDIRQERTLASEAQAVADRLEFIRRMRGERDPVVRLRVVPPARRAA